MENPSRLSRGLKDTIRGDLQVDTSDSDENEDTLHCVALSYCKWVSQPRSHLVLLGRVRGDAIGLSLCDTWSLSPREGETTLPDQFY